SSFDFNRSSTPEKPFCIAANSLSVIRTYPMILPGMPAEDITSQFAKLADHNPQIAEWKLPRVMHIAWETPDKTPVGGVLELPSSYKKGDRKLPLIVAIHGGPTTASHADLEFDPHNGRLYLSAAGYAVLCPNYRGSTGYGVKFVT